MFQFIRDDKNIYIIIVINISVININVININISVTNNTNKSCNWNTSKFEMFPFSSWFPLD